MEARIRELEKAAPREVIDVDAVAENTVVVFSAIEELRKDTEGGWKKLAGPLEQVIEANNLTQQLQSSFYNYYDSNHHYFSK